MKSIVGMPSQFANIDDRKRQHSDGIKQTLHPLAIIENRWRKSSSVRSTSVLISSSTVVQELSLSLERYSSAAQPTCTTCCTINLYQRFASETAGRRRIHF